jgi:hypothetical protein
MRRIACAASILLLAASSAGAAERFEMQSNFWVSLHQTLLDIAANNREVDPTIAEADRSHWINAVTTYQRRFGDRSPVVDEELIRINDALSSATDLPPEGFAEEVTRALLQAAPVYRKHRWANDDRANRFWISAAEGLLRDAGEELVREHVRVYGVAFPARIRVDVAPAAGPFGAYTTEANGLIHTTISSRDPGYQSFAALEMLMHEASHAIVGPANGIIGPEINAYAIEKRLLAPRQLWHAILFYTSGELTRSALLARGVEYTPYARKQNMYDRAFFGLKQSLETFWQSYLEGSIARPVAIQHIVDAVATPAPPRLEGRP